MGSELENIQKAKDKRNNIIVIALSVVLLIVVVLFFMQRRDHKVILNELEIEKDSIHFRLTEISASYDSLSTENDTINEQLMVAQSKVKDLLLEVEQTKKISYQKISGYQKQVTTLVGIMRNYVVQIDSLNARNEELMAENLEVKQQFIQSEQERQQLNKEKERLQQNLKRAAQLEARQLVAEAVNSRSKPTRVVKRAEKIRIYLVLGKNATAKRGPKKVYARIMRPDQMLMEKSEKDLFQFEDLRIQYSAVREVVYEGKDVPLTIWWDNTNEPQLMPGTYTVNIFADGNEIGETTFTLK